MKLKDLLKCIHVKNKRKRLINAAYVFGVFQLLGDNKDNIPVIQNNNLDYLYDNDAVGIFLMKEHDIDIYYRGEGLNFIVVASCRKYSKSGKDFTSTILELLIELKGMGLV